MGLYQGLKSLLVVLYLFSNKNSLKTYIYTPLIIMYFLKYIFRCLFLPSLATVKGVSADSISTGGIGGGKNVFLC